MAGRVHVNIGWFNEWSCSYGCELVRHRKEQSLAPLPLSRWLVEDGRQKRVVESGHGEDTEGVIVSQPADPLHSEDVRMM